MQRGSKLRESKHTCISKLYCRENRKVKVKGQKLMGVVYSTPECHVTMSPRPYQVLQEDRKKTKQEQPCEVENYKGQLSVRFSTSEDFEDIVSKVCNKH